ncbi:tetratricopeptide (TPR) repeat protein, partial [Fusobacterium sp. PH5-44]
KYLKSAADNGKIIAQFELANLYNSQNKLDLAEKYWKLSISPSTPYGYYNLGNLYEKRGKNKLAIQYFELAEKNGMTIANARLKNLKKKKN